mmetsp:Transcript_621/g.1303  ORF Transcript_621/g.1303 Transcript_621/m.1303 type:complete len:172 (+) Transcript_621:93-608(+)
MHSTTQRTTLFSICCLLVLGTTSVHGLAAPTPQNIKQTTNNNSRRAFLSTSAATAFLTLTTQSPQAAQARYILNEETGEYDEVADEDWQTAWGKRLDKAKGMSQEEIFLAAQGAGNTNLREGEESEASKKRRALAGCRNDGFRKKAGGTKDAKECTARVLGGDYQFMVDVM